MLLTKHDSVIIETDRLIIPDLSGAASFKAEASASAGYTDISSPENWDTYWGYTNLNVYTTRDEIDILYQADVWANFTASEKNIFSKWFVASTTERDSVHTAQEQEDNAKICSITVLSLSSDKNITTLTDLIKSAEPSDVSESLSSSLVKDNIDTVDPVIGDDDTKDYSPFSTWLNKTAPRKLWICLDSTTGAAVWKDITSSMSLMAFSFAEMYMHGNTTDTVIDTIDVPVKIAGTTTVGDKSSDFTHISNRLTYTGSVTKKFHVLCTSSSIRTTGAGNKIAVFYVAKQFAIVAKTASPTKDMDSTLSETTFHGIVTLAQNQCVEMFVENKTDDNNFEIQSMIVFVQEIKE